MKKLLQSNDFKISLVFSAIGLIASICVAYYQISVFTEELRKEIISGFGSTQALILFAALQGAFLTFVSTLIGLKAAAKVNLKLHFKFNKNSAVLATFIALATAFIIVGSDRFIFAKYLPGTITTYVFSPIYLISGILYGGIIEEILLRLLVMSLFVLFLWKLFAKSKDNLNIPGWIYISAILLASALFAAGHIPFTIQSIGLSTPILIRCFVLNGLGGIGFGYLYWKKGLAYSMAAHALTHVFMQVVFMPLLF